LADVAAAFDHDVVVVGGVVGNERDHWPAMTCVEVLLPMKMLDKALSFAVPLAAAVRQDVVAATSIVGDDARYWHCS